MGRSSPLQHNNEGGDRCTPQPQLAGGDNHQTSQGQTLVTVGQMPGQYTIGPILSIPGAPAQNDSIHASHGHIEISGSAAQIVAEVADLSMGARKRQPANCEYDHA